MGAKSKAPKESALERELATIGTRWAQINDELFKPVIARQLQRVSPQAQAADRQRLVDQSRTDTAQAFGQARRTVTQAQTLSGARPGSGRFNMGLADLERDAGRSAGLGGNDVAQAVNDQSAINRQAFIDIGLGKASSGATGLGRAAKISTQNAIADSRAAAAARGVRGERVGGIAGAAAFGLSQQTGAPGSADAFLQGYDANDFRIP